VCLSVGTLKFEVSLAGMAIVFHQLVFVSRSHSNLNISDPSFLSKFEFLFVLVLQTLMSFSHWIKFQLEFVIFSKSMTTTEYAIFSVFASGVEVVVDVLYSSVLDAFLAACV